MPKRKLQSKGGAYNYSFIRDNIDELIREGTKNAAMYKDIFHRYNPVGVRTHTLGAKQPFQPGRSSFKGDLRSEFRAELANNQKKAKTSPASAASTSPETQESTNTRSTKVDYSIPGYNGSIALAAGKRLPPCSINLGPNVYLDNTPDWNKLMNKKGRVSTEFNFRMTSSKDHRAHHYQAFRHKWSHDYTAEKDPYGSLLDKSYPAGTIVLGPKHYADNSAGQKIAYKPPGVSASSTLDITGTGVFNVKPACNGNIYFSEVSLTDLYNQSYTLLDNVSHLLFSRNITNGGYASGPEHLLPTSTNSHCRVSYPEYWNGGPYPDPSGVVPNPNQGSAALTQYGAGTETARMQFIPCINSGKIDYSFSNKGLNAARVECIVYRIKKTANLPVSYSLYNTSQDQLDLSNVAALVKDKHEAALQLAYVKAGQARVGLDNLEGAAVNAADIISNPKVKLMPVLKGVVAANDPLVEVERQAFVIGAGDKRQINIKLPGVKENPLTKTKEITRQLNQDPNLTTLQTVANTRWLNTPFDDNCYFVCLSLNGLVSTKTVMDGTQIPVANGSIFTDAEVFCEAVYTESVQACAIKTDSYGIEVYNKGKVLEDTLTGTGVTKSAVILPLSGANFTPSSQMFTPGG